MDLKTTYLGLELKHPIVASASPLSRTLEGIRRLEDAGASAIVLFSLFEEQIRYEQDLLDYLTEVGTETFAESLTYSRRSRSTASDRTPTELIRAPPRRSTCRSSPASTA